MKNDKIKKYLIPNIPYLFILWACLKIGTAYRLAAGADFAHKLLGLGQTIGPAFADFAPGLHPFDWLIGIVGAAGFRLLIYTKSRNAKKFRRDEEYGSARWGSEKDIRPFVDPKFENNVILTGTEFLTMNTRPKIPANARNLNCCVIGSSGSGKTRFWLTPQLLQAHSSFVVVDPKGGVLSQVGAFLQKKKGYKVKVFNSIDFSKSMHYNPLAYIRNEADILKFVDALISNTKGEGKEGDPFWTKSETLLYCALIAYIIFEGPAEDRNMNTLVDMISGMEVKEDDEDFMNAVDYMFAGLEKRKPDCFAVKQYKKYKLASGKTAKSILISCGARLAPFDIPQLREVMSYDELELDRIGDRNCILVAAGANGETSKQYIHDVIAQFSEGDWILLQNEIANVDCAIEYAHARKLRVALNPSPFDDVISRCNLNYVDMLLINEVEGAELTGAAEPEQILSILRTQYMNLSVLLTLGEHGAIFVDSQGIRYHVPSVPCVVKDTTAAGDTFTGYFLTSYFKDYDVSRALAIAAAASSIAVSREGAASSIPYQCEVLTYMK